MVTGVIDVGEFEFTIFSMAEIDVIGGAELGGGGCSGIEVT